MAFPYVKNIIACSKIVGIPIFFIVSSEKIDFAFQITHFSKCVDPRIQFLVIQRIIFRLSFSR